LALHFLFLLETKEKLGSLRNLVLSSGPALAGATWLGGLQGFLLRAQASGMSE